MKAIIVSLICIVTASAALSATPEGSVGVKPSSKPCAKLEQAYTSKDAEVQFGGTWVATDATEQNFGRISICAYALAQVAFPGIKNPTIGFSTTVYDSEETASISMEQQSQKQELEPKAVSGLGDQSYILKNKSTDTEHEQIYIKKANTVINISCELSCNDSSLIEIGKKVLQRL